MGESETSPSTNPRLLYVLLNLNDQGSLGEVSLTINTTFLKVTGHGNELGRDINCSNIICTRWADRYKWSEIAPINGHYNPSLPNTS